MTYVSMDWTDRGASVIYKTHRTAPISCPRCSVEVKPNTQHVCGDREAKAVKRVAKK